MAEERAPIELRVLIVDDDVDAATSFSYVLQILGCKTAVAYGGTMGLRVAQLFQPNLCFVDLDMPGWDGVETLERIRKLEGPVAGAMFVCLTGRNDPDDERRCGAAGFDCFITKPMDSKLLPEILAGARRRLLQAATAAPLPDQPPV